MRFHGRIESAISVQHPHGHHTGTQMTWCTSDEVPPWRNVLELHLMCMCLADLSDEELQALMLGQDSIQPPLSEVCCSSLSIGPTRQLLLTFHKSAVLRAMIGQMMLTIVYLSVSLSLQ